MTDLQQLTTNAKRLLDQNMQHAQFCREFRKSNEVRGITVMFNWDRFESERWPIELCTINSYEQLSSCFLPWYLDSDNKEVNYNTPGAKVLRLSQIPEVLSGLQQDHQDGIKEQQLRYEGTADPICFAVPTYGLPEAKFLILDGCHRLSALMLAQRPFQITFWNVKGPIDENCVSDLRHWDNKSSSEETSEDV